MTSWPQPTPTECATEVCFYHLTQYCPEAEFVKECMYALQHHALFLCSELSINTRQNAGGQVVSTVSIKLPAEEVCAIIASVSKKHSASRGVAYIVKSPTLTTTNEAFYQPWNSRA